MKRDLAYWRALDAKVKRCLVEIMDRPFRAMPKVGGELWLTRQITLALAPPFLLTPVATWMLYPWLPQPEAWLYEAAGVMLLDVAFVAHTDYKKAQQSAGELSESPPDAGEGSKAVPAGQWPADGKPP